MKTTAKLLFHSPCFDGIVSAVIASDYLRRHQDWPEMELQSVNYDIRSEWLAQRFEGQTAIVDFLFHPEASFWADHHPTTFLTPELKQEALASDRPFIYDNTAGSCAGLLWRRLPQNERFRELVVWAEKIDAARYESVEEALGSEYPAIKITRSLTLSERGYPEGLVLSLSRLSLEETAELPEVREKWGRAEALMDLGYERFRKGSELRDGIAVFDVDATDVLVNRYSPYRFFPKARYSVGITRHKDRTTITAMRNPWWEFESVPLGEIFVPFGGGGHRRVASLIVKEGNDPRAALEAIVQLIHASDRQLTAEARD